MNWTTRPASCFPVSEFPSFCQTVEKRFVVAVVKKYLAPVVAAGHHMIEQSLRMDSGMSGHKAPPSKLVDLGKSDTNTPANTIRVKSCNHTVLLFFSENLAG
jgi:hypothetical protein